MMLADRSECSGCGACVDACRFGALSIVEDEDGFRQVKAAAALCQECHACERSCPVISHPGSAGRPLFLAGRLKDAGELFFVSSGGVFWALAKAMLARGGVVYGARQDRLDQIRHARAETADEAMSFRRSKYLQSDLTGIYSAVRADLDAGREILFSGTGCQCAALLSFLGGRKPGLVTVEVVCHGVPSASAWRKYLWEVAAASGKGITGIVYRDKSAGWLRNSYKLSFDDGSAFVEPSLNNAYHHAYLRGFISRESCASCRFTGLPRVADLTLADYWKYDGGSFPSDDRGVSLVVANGEGGLSLLEDSRAFADYEPTGADRAGASCRHLLVAPAAHPARHEFLEYLRTHAYFRTFGRFVLGRRSWWERLLDRIGTCMMKWRIHAKPT